MKKYLFFFMSIFLTFFSLGCNLGNTPTSKVEDLLMKYQKLDEDITNDINEVLEEENLTNEQKERYKKLLEEQYKNLSYKIKNEEIDGDNAVVTIELEVMDYNKAKEKTEEEYEEIEEYTVEEYNNKKLDNLEDIKEKVVYTIEITLNKDKDGNWKLNALTNVDKKKLQGMY